MWRKRYGSDAVDVFDVVDVVDVDAPADDCSEWQRHALFLLGVEHGTCWFGLAGFLIGSYTIAAHRATGQHRE